MKNLFLLLVSVILLTAFSGTAYAAAKPAKVVNNVTNKTLAFNKLGAIESNLLKAGPQEAKSLTNVSGKLFAYLAVISLIVWVIQNLLFGDKGIKEFFVFALFIAFVRGLLAGYNLFFVGTVNMFYSLGQRVGGVTNPFLLFQNIFYDFYGVVGSQFSLLNKHLTVWNAAALLPTAGLYFAGIIVLIIAFLLVAGTIFLIEAYIVIALVTGYIFVPMMIFKPLEFLWNGWLKFLISSALAYFIVFVVLKMFSLFMVNTLQNYVNALNANATYNIASIINELVYTFILFLFGYLVTKIPAIAGEIVSGMPNMSVSAIIAPVVNSFNKMSGGGGKTASKTVGEIKSAAGRGGK
ncbi:MAG: type IV secretion system protein [Deltaproteobacteria bacterium]|jgi:hypothetical protein|nr:type IV secretion system protein [Deltaproteobacteria bacterium]MCL5880944.1 type IV secretion system protein [Deltaproteobacteria bacterium]MDA8303588.1 type IV secretion system protein [Deltaproteobacteria bacterium]